MNGKRGTPEEETRGRGPEIKNYRICTRTIEILEKSNIKQLFPIQQGTFDLIYDGKDIMGRDITGSGKTLAYVLPLVERFRAEGVLEARRRSSDKPHLVMIIVPTRELALQVSTVLDQVKHSDEYRVQAVYGGAPIDPQIDGLRRGAEFVVGTTGRLPPLFIFTILFL